MTSTEPLTGIPYLEPIGDDAVVAAKQALLPEAAGKIVLVGDSSCLMDLVPDVIAKETGVPTINLGTLAHHTLVGYENLAEQSLELRPLPRAIVLALLPRSLTVSEADAHEPGLLSRTMIAYGRSNPLVAPTFSDWRRWLYFKHRFNIFPPEFEGSYRRFEEALRKESGWYPEKKIYKGFSGTRRVWKPASFAQSALIRLAKRCSQAKVPLYFWWSPSPADALETNLPLAAETWQKELAKNERDIHFLQSAPPVWPIDQFGSPTHLTPQSARRISSDLALALKRAMTP